MLDISVFTLLLQMTVDLILDVKFNLYGYFKEGVDLISFITFLGIYPAFAIITVNYYPYKKRLLKKLYYVIIVSIFCLGYESLSLYTKYFYHRTWSLLYSALCYPFLICIIAMYLSLIRKLSLDNKVR
ncbi:CBO0543 family protein [Clostridium yunnanense]|uniref:CBO0543 family protein n=1 Tax=Clostridium yunnanense TaxID=2800325 RepID=UPI003B848A30